ncbi:phage tail protein [Roseobacter sp. HKCCA0434]|uniref:phage tail protein n=1 Tax=Roseobacter sp. HKCCA0434 TaxID=3079297 RepID=UPI002905DC7F|nr:phage tail protein [Roseobacter sp. HKCCA0434]
MPTGMIYMWGGSNSALPNGYLLCDGSQVSQTQYKTLFSVIGHSFGAGATDGMFFLPDLRGRFVRGVDGGSGNDPDLDARHDMQNPSTSYSGVGSVQGTAMQSHGHGYNGVVKSDDGNVDWSNKGGYNQSWYVSAAPSVQLSDSENRPLNAALHFIIET